MPLSVGASIVLYRTHVRRVAGLIDQLLAQGAARVYLVDNSPLEFDSFSGWTPPERVVVIRTGRNLGYGAGNNLAISDSVLRHEFHPDLQSGHRSRPGPALPRLVAAMSALPARPSAWPKVIGTRQRIAIILCKRSPLPIDYVASALRKYRVGRASSRPPGNAGSRLPPAR